MRPRSIFGAVLGWGIAGRLFALSFPDIKRKYVVLPAYRALKGAMPTISDTEREALEAGTVGWDAELFSGTPDLDSAAGVPPITLTAEERAFLDGPTDELCRKLNDWRIRHELHDIPEDIWRLRLRAGLSRHAHLQGPWRPRLLRAGAVAGPRQDLLAQPRRRARSSWCRTRSGPGELIEKYGTEAQKEHYLPRLARGEEIPALP